MALISYEVEHFHAGLGHLIRVPFVKKVDAVAFIKKAPLLDCKLYEISCIYNDISEEDDEENIFDEY